VFFVVQKKAMGSDGPATGIEKSRFIVYNGFKTKCLKKEHCHEKKYFYIVFAVGFHYVGE
jgi:hypothetical protein